MNDNHGESAEREVEAEVETEEGEGKNKNCLEDMKCPKCGSLEPFEIRATAIFRVYDDGCDEFVDLDWENEALCMCCACDYDGVVQHFMETGK